MTTIDLLDKAIILIAGNDSSSVQNERVFCDYSKIKASTVRAWRKRAEVPEDKEILLKLIIEKYELEQKMAKVEEFFKLQKDISSMFEKNI